MNQEKTISKPAKGLQIQATDSVAEELLKYVSKYIDLTAEEKEFILSQLDIRAFNKGVLLLEQGKLPEECYFVLKGCIRQYYLVEGEEITTNFFTEGMPVNTFTSTQRNQPSPYFLSCVEECILSVGSNNDTENIYNPRMARICREAIEDELSNYQQMLSWYLITNPEERYLSLMESRPDLIDRVPLYQLAGYLGVKPESLSRIRKRILSKGK